MHRDLKPSNVMVSSDGRVKVLDFGLSKLREPSAGPGATSLQTEELTGEDRILGTAAYMSPEQAEGRQVDERSDIFSLAIVLYQMATGRHPFRGETKASMISAILRDTPSSVIELRPELPRHLSRIIKHGLEKDVRRRYQAALDLRNDLAELKAEVDSGEVMTGSALLESRVARRPRSRLHLVAAVAAAALLLAVSGWLLLRPRAPAAPVRAVPLTSWSGSEREPALSPSGEQVAFVWDGESGDRFDLYVMLPGAGEPLRLSSGPGEARHPTWSPDGREIAFLRRSERGGHTVVAVPALGGGERVLGATAEVGFPGLDWSPDGRLLAVVDREPQEPQEAIYVLSTATGERRRVTAAASGAIGDRSPVFSPDGRSLASVRWYEVPKTEVFVTSLDSGESRRLMTHDGWIRGLDWLRDGSALVFSSAWRGSTGLWRLSLDGEAKQLSVGQNALDLTISTSGDRLVYSQLFPDTNLWRVGGPVAAEPGHPGKFIASTRDDWGPQYSPDGGRIAFTSDRSGVPQIWISDAEGGSPTLVHPMASAIMPRWSPDGREIAFSGEVEGQMEVFVLDVEGGFPRRLTSSPQFEAPWSWSRDGRWVYIFSDRTGVYQVWKVRPEGGEPVQITRGGGALPLESSDGRFLYYLKDRPLMSFWKVPVEGGEESPVLEKPGLTRSAFDLWRDSLVYLVEDEERGPRIERLDLPSGEIEVLVELGRETRIGKYGRICVSPDGRWVLFPRDDSRGSDLILVENFR